jgi:hypothetical protein
VNTPPTQPTPANAPAATPAPAPKRGWRLLPLAGGLLLAYLLVAYVVLPLGWRTAAKRHPDLSGGPRITETANGIHGDPVNLALLGSETNLIHAMIAAGWHAADPITLSSSLRIAADSVFRRPDSQAPVSDLFLFGRKQDLAFEQPVGNSPRQRHHVRFWRWDRLHDNREVWFGAATFDERVGLSHDTAQITHHIGPEVDAERELIMKQLQQAGWTQEAYYVDGFHHELQGRNGGGDPWHTDGRLGVVVLRTGPLTASAGTNPPAKP